MKIGAIRDVIATSTWSRLDLSGHTRDEFRRRDLPKLLTEQIQSLRSLAIPLRFAREIEQRDAEIQYCEKILTDWYSQRTAT